MQNTLRKISRYRYGCNNARKIYLKKEIDIITISETKHNLEWTSIDMNPNYLDSLFSCNKFGDEFKSFIVLILYYFFAQQFSLPLLQGTFPNLLYLLYMLAFLLSRLNVGVMHLSLQHLLLLIHQDHLHNNR